MDEFATKYVGFRVDTGEAISGIEEIEAALTKLEKTTGSISAVITSAFSPFSDNVQALENDVTALNESSLLPAPKSDGDGTSGLLGLASNADMLTAGLAELIAAWGAEAIAKAASTAAVTAWNGICGAASPGRLKTVPYRSTRNYAGRDNFCRVWPVITRIRRLNGGPYPGGA